MFAHEKLGFLASCLHKRKLLLRKCQQLMKIFPRAARSGGFFENTPLLLSIFSPEKQNPLKCASLSQTTCGPPSAFQSLAYRRHRKRPLTVKFNSAENQTEKWKQNMDLCFISGARLTCLSAVLLRSSRPAFFILNTTNTTKKPQLCSNHLAAVISNLSRRAGHLKWVVAYICSFIFYFLPDLHWIIHGWAYI